ncbi:MAG: hypothetical protein ACRED3_21020 [Bradyrhizobium sp.]
MDPPAAYVETMRARSAVTIVVFMIMLMFSDALDWRVRIVNVESPLAVPFVIFGMLGVAYAIGFGGVRLLRTFQRWHALRD